MGLADTLRQELHYIIWRNQMTKKKRVLNPLNKLRKRYLERLDHWAHKRGRLCPHRPVGTRHNLQDHTVKYYYEDEPGVYFDENPEPDHDDKKCRRKLTWWEKRLCDAWDVWIAQDPHAKRTWPLTPLWNRRDLFGDCEVKHWWRFHNPPATHQIRGTIVIGNRKSSCITGQFCARHAPPEAEALGGKKSSSVKSTPSEERDHQ